MLLSSLAVNAQTKVEIEGIWYNLIPNGKAAHVTYKSSYSNENKDQYFGSVTIPTIVTYEGVDYNVTSIGYAAFRDCSSLTAITIPESVTSIGDYAFSSCRSLTAITIPESVTSIGEGAFLSCSSLTAITLPEGVTCIEWFAFEECSNLTSIIIPENSQLTSIKGNAFLNCSSLTSITIPKNVTSISDLPFYGCSGLSSIIVADGNTIYDSRSGCNAVIETGSNTLIVGCNTTIIPEGVKSIGDYAFSSCRSLTAITIPQSVTSIGEAAFSSSGLISITIPESITSLERSAFSNCNSLTTIVLPKKLKNIGSQAFASCEGLLDVYCHAEEVPSALNDAFDYSYLKYATLHVPASALNAYESTAPWSNFGTIVALEGTAPLEKCATPTISYVGGEVVFACATEEATVVSDTKETTEYTAGNHNALNFALIPSYTITAYATKDKYENSDEVTVTLCWIPCTENHEGEEETGILTIPAKPVLIQTDGGTITMNGLAEGTVVKVNDLNGVELGTATATGGTATITTNLTAGSVAVVQMGNQTIKVAIK